VTDEAQIVVKYRCLRDLVFAADSGVDVDGSLINRVRWEEELCRQAMETPHAVVSQKIPSAYFEVHDYRLMWRALQNLLPFVPVGLPVPRGLLLAKLGEEEPKYFRGHAGMTWLDYIMDQAACGLRFALEHLAPVLHARHDMKHWKSRNHEFIELLDKTTDPILLHTEWRSEAYNMSLAHDGGAVGKTVNQLIRGWDAADKDNRNIIRTGLEHIDKYNAGGHGRGELMVIGGGTGHGKSFCAQRIMRAQAAMKQRALYISVEDDADLFTARFIADYSSETTTGAVSPADIRQKKVDPVHVDEMKAMADDEQGDTLYFFHAKKWTASRICDVIRRHRYLCGVDLVIVDYLQAISPDEVTNQKANDTAIIVSQLKACCGDCEVALILLSQYARDEYRGGIEPTITSCKWSGDIENESEVMLLLWRDEADVLHAKIAKLKWAKSAGRRFIIPTNDMTGCMMDWEDDFSQPQQQQQKGDRRDRRGRNGKSRASGEMGEI
jgi:archaellum biogenesis ATPase FlaH